MPSASSLARTRSGFGLFGSGRLPALPRVSFPARWAASHRDRPEIVVALREGTSAVLTRSLRAGSLDIALLAGVPPYTPPDDREPVLDIEILAEGPLRIAVGASHQTGWTGTRTRSRAHGRAVGGGTIRRPGTAPRGVAWHRRAAERALGRA